MSTAALSVSLPQPSGFLTEVEAAAFLGVTRKTLSNWRSSDRHLPYIKVGRLIRYRKADLDAWLASRTVRPAGK